MCGFLGIQLKTGEVVPQSMLEMGILLKHRGPDNFSVFRDGNIGVAHTRLSILDLSEAGHQPYYNERYLLCYNGEIYNYRELRQKLERCGVSFRSTSDTAVLFEHLVHYGVEETLKNIQGMFAFSFCDLKERTVYLCRDRLGFKPLIWKSDDTGTYWASEVKALHPITKVEVDPIKTLYAITSSGDNSRHATVFKDVEQVPPGCYLICRPSRKPQCIRYYDLLQDIDERYYNHLDGLSFSESKALFSSLIKKSVEKMLMSDAPMGIFVSGGVDSALIAAISKEFNPQISLFTTNVEGSYSEYDKAFLLAKFLGKQLNDFTFSPQMMISEWARATYYYECPIVTHTNAIPMACVAELARHQGVKAVLTGEGSDELFLGYPRLHAEKFKNMALLPINSLKKTYGKISGLNEYLFPQEMYTTDKFYGQLVQGFQRGMLKEEAYKALSFLPPNKIADQYSTLKLLYEHLITLLHRNDRMGMISSIEARFPFLDEEMVKFGINLPTKWKRGLYFKFHNYKHPFILDKKIVRATATDYLPQKLAYQVKEGFPMYGHKNIRVAENYFHDGYIESVFKLSRRAQEFMIRTQPAYFIAKLVSVEIFGRLYAMRQSIEEVTEWVLEKTVIRVV